MLICAEDSQLKACSVPSKLTICPSAYSTRQNADCQLLTHWCTPIERRNAEFLESVSSLLSVRHLGGHKHTAFRIIQKSHLLYTLLSISFLWLKSPISDDGILSWLAGLSVSNQSD